MRLTRPRFTPLALESACGWDLHMGGSVGSGALGHVPSLAAHAHAPGKQEARFRPGVSGSAASAVLPPTTLSLRSGCVFSAFLPDSSQGLGVNLSSVHCLKEARDRKPADSWSSTSAFHRKGLRGGRPPPEGLIQVLHSMCRETGDYQTANLDCPHGCHKFPTF